MTPLEVLMMIPPDTSHLFSPNIIIKFLLEFIGGIVQSFPLIFFSRFSKTPLGIPQGILPVNPSEFLQEFHAPILLLQIHSMTALQIIPMIIPEISP